MQSNEERSLEIGLTGFKSWFCSSLTRTLGKLLKLAKSISFDGGFLFLLLLLPTPIFAFFPNTLHLFHYSLVV